MSKISFISSVNKLKEKKIVTTLSEIKAKYWNFLIELSSFEAYLMSQRKKRALSLGWNKLWG